MKDLRSCLSVVPDAATFATRGAELVTQRAKRAIDARGRFTIALTGGSTPIDLYRALVTAPIDWTRVEVLWGDERAVPGDHPESNARAAFQALLDHVALPASQVHPMDGAARDLSAAAQSYEALVRRVVPGDPIPTLDLMLIGIGADGHVLSLFPTCPQIVNPTALVVALHDPKMNPHVDRITMTPPMLQHAREVMLLASGSGKADALAAAVQGDDDVLRTPAQLVRTALGEVTVLCDRAAASKLTNA